MPPERTGVEEKKLRARLRENIDDLDARKRLADAEPEPIQALRREFFAACRVVQARGGRLVYPYAALVVVATRPRS